MQVLFVCTANMCRSPMAAALFSRCLGGDETHSAASDVVVRSAGLLPGGYPSPPEVVTVLHELGIDASARRSVQVTPELVGAADVVVAMARRHAREVVLLDAAAWARTFTLKDIVRRGDTHGGRVAGEALGTWLERLHDGRARTELVGSSSDDDVPDPLGGSVDEFRTSARQLRSLVERLADLLGVSGGVRASPE